MKYAAGALVLLWLAIDHIVAPGLAHVLSRIRKRGAA